MIKNFISIFALFATISVFGQKAINNTKTEKHMQIPGTKFFLIPPDGFVSAKDFSGLQQMENGASIIVMDMPAPYSVAVQKFSKQEFKTKGVLVQKTQEMKVNGKQGLFITAEQSSQGINFSKYLLVFGDSKNTYLLNASFPKAFEELDAQIRGSIFSVVYDEGLSVDSLNAVPFSIDTENTKMKFAKNLMGSLMFTADGNVPTRSNDKTNFSVGPSLGPVKINDQKQTAIARIRKFQYKDLKMDEENITEIEIDGISGYEIIAEGIDAKTGVKELAYQVMLFPEEGYYILLGTATEDFEQNLEMFRKLARTFKRK